MMLSASTSGVLAGDHTLALLGVLITPAALAPALFGAAFLARRGSRPASAWLGALAGSAPLARLVALLVLLDAGLHAGLVPGHAAAEPVLAGLFGLDALALALVAAWATSSEGWEPVALVLLVANLVAYALFVDTGREDADAVGLGCQVLQLSAIALTIAHTIRWTDGPVREGARRANSRPPSGWA